jgi:hypothetical protein
MILLEDCASGKSRFDNRLLASKSRAGFPKSDNSLPVASGRFNSLCANAPGITATINSKANPRGPVIND